MLNVDTSWWDLREVSLDIRAVWPPAQPDLTSFYGSRRVAAGWLFWNLPLMGQVSVFPSGNLNQLIPSIPTALTFISSKISVQIVPSLLDLQLQSSLIAFNQMWPPPVDTRTIKPLFCSVGWGLCPPPPDVVGSSVGMSLNPIRLISWTPLLDIMAFEMTLLNCILALF